ncbi:hypothetical protein OIU76_004935 [Salix suchowensis]|nr:hypothetical protein OIU76_004935 [Salix suchowensis]
MGDSETVVTEPPAVMNCTARLAIPLMAMLMPFSNIVPVPGVYIAEGAGNFTASFVAAQAAYTGNAYGTDSTYIVPYGHVEAAYGTEAVVGTGSTINNAAVAENASFVSPQAAGYDSAVDGNTSTEAGVVLSDENGNAGEVVGGADAVQQFMDGSGAGHLKEITRYSLLEAITKHANMERRLGNLEDAFSLYEQAIAIEKGKELPLVLPALYAQYARFIYLTSKNLLKARKVLVEALENAQFSKLLLEALIHLEIFLPQPKQIDYLDSLVDNFILTSSDSVNTASAAERAELSCIFLEMLLGIFGDAQSIKKAADWHAKFFLPHSSKSELKKRHAEDYLSSDRAKIAKPYSDATSPPQSLMGAYTSAQNQWTAGYGLQPQAWPPATQVQTQQWTPGFNQQVAYGGYGGSYTSPQVPTSVAQGAVYGAYPPTYPAQAFSQQSYAQPVAALTPAQQPASVPQPYYGSYY